MIFLSEMKPITVRLQLFSLLALFSLLWPTAQALDRLTVGGLTLPWPDGWKLIKTNQDLRLSGPNAERGIISQLPLPSDQPHSQQALEQFAKDTLPDTAGIIGGQVIRALEKRQLATGLTLYSTLSRQQKTAAEQFYLQYLVIGEESGTLLTLQGTGSAEHAAKTFDLALSQARWLSLVPTSHQLTLIDVSPTPPRPTPSTERQEPTRSSSSKP